MSITDPVASKIKTLLTEYQRYISPKTDRHAAVLFPIICHNNSISIVLTKRSKEIPHHSGEISFPGGMQNGDTEQLEDTALRETCEEIGIGKEDIQIIGKLDDEISLAGHRVTPFVGILKPNSHHINYTINSDEVDEIITIPLQFFNETKTAWTEKWVRNGDYRTVYFYRYQNHIVWGLTARIIYKAVKILRPCILDT